MAVSVAAAGPLLADARAAVDGLLATKQKNPAKKAAKQLKKAEKKLSAAGTKLSKGKKAKSIVNLLKKAAKAQLLAASELEESE